MHICIFVYAWIYTLYHVCTQGIGLTIILANPVCAYVVREPDWRRLVYLCASACMSAFVYMRLRVRECVLKGMCVFWKGGDVLVTL